MTPAARVAAAIEILDKWRAGQPVEQALTRWARKSRFAGSKDRAAIRDHVFDSLRLTQTAAALGGGDDGRALMLGLLRHQGDDPSVVFTGDRYAPAALSVEEQANTAPEPTKFFWNLPAWLINEFEQDLGADAEQTARALTARAPVTLRVNAGPSGRSAAIDHLRRDGIETELNDLADTALTITHGARRLRQSHAYLSGVVELQDAASQAVVAALPEATRCLDYCAGGGGKSLALAAQKGRHVTACDIDPKRMQDIPPRAERAGVTIDVIDQGRLTSLAPFDLVLCDAPCSGSGAWRRSPEAKWSFTESRLAELRTIQKGILEDASTRVAPQGWLVYATCSVLRKENEAAVARFLEGNKGWTCIFSKRWDVTAEGDGFYTAHLKRVDAAAV